MPDRTALKLRWISRASGEPEGVKRLFPRRRKAFSLPSSPAESGAIRR